MVACARCWCASAILLTVLGSSPAADEALSRVQISKMGKAATALVEVNKGEASGSAFCIHPSGLFITNDHVVRGPKHEVRLVLDSGLPTQKELRALVVRTDRQRDLALLRAVDEGKYAALALGSEENLSELTEVVAFGFPFGKGLTLEKDTFPAVTVNAGSVTALRRKKGGALERIQLDAGVNPGSSGGPLLDLSGKVVGVVVSGLVARGVGRTGINFAIPVSHVARFVAPPDIQFTPPALDRANAHAPVPFQARAVSLLPGARPVALELILTAEERQKRYPMAFADGVYRVTAVPLLPREELCVLACRVVAVQDGKEVGRRSETVAIRGVGDNGLAIKPPALDQHRVVQRLPAPVADLAVGGGGRFLVMHLPALGQLAVFDVNKARITQRIPVANDVQFAAGLDKLLVVSPGEDLVQRYSLRTGDEEWTGPLLIRGLILGLAMGSASQGPVLVHWSEGPQPMSRTHYTMCGPEDLRPLSWGQVDGPPYFSRGWEQGRSRLRASPEGTLFLLRGFKTLRLVGQVAWPGTTECRAWVGYAAPGPGGHAIYTAAGLFTSEFKRLSDSWLEMYSLIPAQAGHHYLALPHLSPSLYGGLPRDSNLLERAPGVPGMPPLIARDRGAIYSADNNQLLSTLADIELPAPPRSTAPDDFTYDKRVNFIPAARLIVTFPDHERLALHRLRPEDLEGQGPWVSSKPPAAAACGTTYRYQIEARSPNGAVEYRLESGPPGMTLSRSGLIEWPIPDHLGPAVCYVRVGVRDAARQSCEHRFTVFVDEGSPLVTIPTPPPRTWVFSADRRRLAGVLQVTERPSEAVVWDVKTGREINRFEGGGLGYRIALSADGRRLAGFSESGAAVWDVDTRKSLLKLDLRGQEVPFPSHPSPMDFTLSPDGRRLAAPPRGNFNRPPLFQRPTELNLWDVGAAKLVATLRGGNDKLGWVLFNPDGKRVAATFGGTLKIFAAADGRELLTLKLPPAPSASWSPDGKHLVLAYLDKPKILDVDTGREIDDAPAGPEPPLPPTPRLEEQMVSPDGKLLARRSEEGVKAFNLATGDEVLRLLGVPEPSPVGWTGPGLPGDAVSSPVGFTGPQEGHLVVMSGSGIRVWELTRSNDGPEPPRSGVASSSPTAVKDRVTRKLAAPVTDAAVGGGGRYLLLRLPQLHQLAVFDVKAAAFVSHIPISEDGAFFAAGLEEVVVLLPGAGTIERWNLKTLRREAAAPMPLGGVIKAVGMGSASRGPLLVHWAVGTQPLDHAAFALVNAETMKVLAREVGIGAAF